RRLAVEQDGAGAANAVLAADMHLRATELLAQEVAQQQAWLRESADLRAIEREGDEVALPLRPFEHVSPPRSHVVRASGPAPGDSWRSHERRRFRRDPKRSR